MARIRAYTTVEQSRKLAEILPLESADMTYCAITEVMREKMTIKNWEVNVGLDIAIKKNLFSYRSGYMIPCWSLASLLGVLPEKYTELIKEGGMYRIIIKDSYITSLFENPVDACVVMIGKLNKLNLL